MYRKARVFKKCFFWKKQKREKKLSVWYSQARESLTFREQYWLFPWFHFCSELTVAFYSYKFTAKPISERAWKRLASRTGCSLKMPNFLFFFLEWYVIKAACTVRHFPPSLPPVLSSPADWWLGESGEAHMLGCCSGDWWTAYRRSVTRSAHGGWCTPGPSRFDGTPTPGGSAAGPMVVRAGAAEASGPFYEPASQNEAGLKNNIPSRFWLCSLHSLLLS